MSVLSRPWVDAGRPGFLASAILFAALLCCQVGCVSTKYKLVQKNTTPAEALNLVHPTDAPLQTTLVSLITFGGPGSWKQQALWDEYVVSFANRGDTPLTIDNTALADGRGDTFFVRGDPWALEEQSRQLEKKYRAGGETFVRYAGPVAVWYYGTLAALPYATGVTAGVNIIMASTTVALPAYYIVAARINSRNKRAVVTEFYRRRLSFPLTLAPGETRTGSLFYPMVRSPQSLAIEWSHAGQAERSSFPLDMFRNLHAQKAGSR